MHPELIYKIKKTYPLAAEYKGCFEFGDGWYGIIVEMFDYLHNHTLEDGSEPIKFEQFKEKFGTLRIYEYGGDEVSSNIISMAEHRSAYICEMCGEPGTLGGSSWIRTLCDEHKKQFP